MCSALLLCLTSFAQPAGDVPSVAELLAGTRRRAESYINLKFTYTVRATYWPGQGIPGMASGRITRRTTIDALDTLAILASDRRDMPWPWMCWTRSVKDDQGAWVLQLFAWDHGTECAEYLRQSEIEAQHLYASSGHIFPGRGPVFFADNLFVGFIQSDLNGSQWYFDFDWTRSAQHHLHMKWQHVGERVCCNRRTFVLGAKHKNEHVDGYWEVWVTGPPDYLILRREAKFANWKEPAIDEVTSVHEQHGIAYPAAGRSVRPASDILKRREYEFSVTSVERLTEANRKDWRPEWPAGTRVIDKVRDKIFEIPYPPGEEERIRRAIRPQFLPTVSAPSRSPMFVFNIAMFLLFVAALFVYRYKRRRAARMAGGSP